MSGKMSRTSHVYISDGDVFYAKWDAIQKFYESKTQMHVARLATEKWVEIRELSGNFGEFIFQWDEVDDENYMGMQIYYERIIDGEVCKKTALIGFAVEGSRFETFFTRIKPMPEWEMKRPNTTKAKRGW
jgi:hypothetical protein